MIHIHPTDLLTIGLLVALEALLSADNAMVLAVLVLGLPERDRHKALRYGILGAFAFRSAGGTLFARCLVQLAAGPQSCRSQGKSKLCALRTWGAAGYLSCGALRAVSPAFA